MARVAGLVLVIAKEGHHLLRKLQCGFRTPDTAHLRFEHVAELRFLLRAEQRREGVSGMCSQFSARLSKHHMSEVHEDIRVHNTRGIRRVYFPEVTGLAQSLDRGLE